MKQPVLVGLYFSRSGQELFVQLPIPVQKTADARRNELSSHRAKTTSAAAFVEPALSESAKHTR